jgi:hypothetical protein
MQRGIRSREPDEAGRQLDAPLGALQELHPDFQFQPTNLLAQGGCAIPSLRGACPKCSSSATATK